MQKKEGCSLTENTSAYRHSKTLGEALIFNGRKPINISAKMERHISKYPNPLKRLPLAETILADIAKFGKRETTKGKQPN
jgi:hypothetical protein